jgi:predicted O-linked N-acetylglucosamine transferase (SPINDLY family)
MKRKLGLSDKLYQEAVAAFNNRELLDAVRLFKRVLAAHPKHVAALNLLTVVLMSMERFAEAEEFISRAVRLNQRSDVSFYNYGIILKRLKKPAFSLAQFDHALRLNPKVAETWNNRGTVLSDLHRYDDAVLNFNTALELNPQYTNAYCNKGKSLDKLKRYDEALAAYDKALEIEPDLENAWLGRGNVFSDLKRHDAALAAYDRALEINFDCEGAWLGRGSVFTDLRLYDEAFAAFDQIFTLDPNTESVEGARLHSKMHLCDWSNFDNECAHLFLSIRRGRANTEPFAVIPIPSSAEDQLKCAKLWVSKKYPPHQEPLWKGESYRHKKIRVAYVSADFHQHATAFLMAGMFEYRDESRFAITAISLGRDDKSETRERLKRSFDHFLDASRASDEWIASYIKDQEIDILIDLKGFTKDARTNVFARRAAPIQVNYLGYPGTTGASYIDYLIADLTIIPHGSRRFYSEKIVTLPNTYQANDRKRLISNKSFNRSDEGLPSQEFVFCCFNNNYKITPHVFERWMSILKQVEGSVLWLLDDNTSAAINLKKEAVARGVSPDRLIFAKRLPLPDHLARHRLADLFLDTFPYNAHTTASDALWAGLPVLTCLGETFAGRVAASLLNAIQLPELINPTLEAYERMAIDLAVHPERLREIGRKLAQHRLSAPLFDTQLFTKHIESAYTAMYERHQGGLAPDHITIST